MAVDYGISIGLEAKDLISALLITQFVGFPSAIGFGFLGRKFGTRPAIFLAIFVYLFVSIWAAFMKSSTEFYVLAVIVGLVQGGIQALSRSYYARLIPVAKSAEYFGFYNMVGKFSAIIGPALMGGTGLIVRYLGYDSDTASRISIASVALFFMAGGVLFYFVSEEKGKKELEYL
ncbi:conserved domain protein [delta proteobacterium NaphS2]|nr:conserved domain protein [delta proteobacterium NaphS2]